MSELESFADRLRLLEDLGVPAHVREFVGTQTYPKWRWRYIRDVVLMLVVGVGVPSALCVFFFGYAARLEAERVRGAYFVDDSPGWSMILLFFGGMLTLMGTLSLVQRQRDPRYAQYVAIRSLLDAANTRGLSGRITAWLLKRENARLAGEDPGRFLAQHSVRLMRRLTGFGGVLMLLSIPAVAADLRSYDRGTADGLERHGVFASSLVPWSRATKVGVGCYVSERDGPSARYEIEFGGGPRLNAFPKRATERSLDGLSQLDAMLRSRAVPFERAHFAHGINRGKVFDSPGCVEELAFQSGVDPHRLRMLLAT